MKPISCNQLWGTQKGFCAQHPHRALLGITLVQVSYTAGYHEGSLTLLSWAKTAISLQSASCLWICWV